MITIKRIYEQAQPSDGIRLLVDRVWPRGISKDKADLTEWLKDVAPSKELRQWFNHEADRFEAFKTAYIKELRQEPAKSAVAKILAYAETGKVTLLYGAKDPHMNQAAVLAEYLKKR